MAVNEMNFTQLIFALQHFAMNSYSGIPRNFVGGVVQQIQLRTEERENRDLGAAAP
jgi:hypothetical protein